MSSSSSPGEGYEKALGLLQQLQNTIETQQKDISRLQSRVKSLRGQNDELRRERDELRESLADKMSKIAELSRKTSSMKGRVSLPSLQNSTSPPVQREPDFRTSGDYAEPIPLVTVEGRQVGEEEALEQGRVTLRRSRSRGDSESRKGVYLPSTPPIVPRQSRRDSRREREEANTEQEEQEQDEQEEEEDQDSSEEEEEEEVSITPIPQHLLDSERFNNSSDMSTDLSSNEGSITSMDDCRSPASSVTASPTHDSINFMFMQTPTDPRGFPHFGSEEEENPITASMPQPMRSRLATVAHVAQRRKKTTDDKVTKSSSLHRQNSFPRRGRKLSENEDSFQLSPDMELKIQQLIQEGLGKKYGGLDRANRAAAVIQKAYRKHKIDLHFKMLRKMQQDQAGGIRERRRTMSVRHRATSILKNKLSATKMAQVRENMCGLSPSISRRELRKKPSPSSSLIAESSSSSSLKADEGEDETPPSIFEGLSSSSLRDLFPPGPPRQLSKSALERKKNIGTNIFNRKPVKGIQYLVYHGVLKDDPSDVANYLKDQYGLSKEKIGEFVGEIRYDFNMIVLECLVQLIDLSGKSIDEALRRFQLLFRMPGEAQKIDKVMQVFAGEYYHSNKDGGIIKSEDAAYVLSFAIMMLHTDLHNPSVKRHMAKNDWIKMNRGNNDNEDFPSDYLLQIYERIQQREFATGRDHTHEVAEIKKLIIGSGCPPLLNPQRRFIKLFQVQQVKDMHKRVMRRHKRTLLLFNDVLLVVKAAAGSKYEYRKSFTLLNSQIIEFHTHNYKFGVCVQQELNGETYCCNCESSDARKELLGKVSEAIFELKEMEKERIIDFGMKGTHKEGGAEKTNEPAGDLLSSKNLSSSADDLFSLGQKDKVDFRRVATTNAVRDSMKRSSKDSGFDSPHTISPSPIGTDHTSTGVSAGGVTVTVISSSSLSPKRERTRSRTPEPRRTMKVYPETSNKLTLSPSHIKVRNDKSTDRKSMPPDAMGRLQAASVQGTNGSMRPDTSNRLSLSPSFSGVLSSPKKKTQRTLSNRS